MSASIMKYAGVRGRPDETPPEPQVGDRVAYGKDIGDKEPGAYDHVYVGTGIPYRACLEVISVGSCGISVKCGTLVCARKQGGVWTPCEFLFLYRPVDLS